MKSIGTVYGNYKIFPSIMSTIILTTNFTLKEYDMSMLFDFKLSSGGIDMAPPSDASGLQFAGSACFILKKYTIHCS